MGTVTLRQTPLLGDEVRDQCSANAMPYDGTYVQDLAYPNIST